MKTILFILVLGISFSSYAQENAATTGAPGCGPDQETFDVTTAKNPSAIAPPEAGKTSIYVLQDDRQFESRPRPTTRVGVDGKWVGAMHSNSYLHARVEPREHHLCTSWQSFVGIGFGLKVAALHFTAEAGKSYYFVVKDKWSSEHGRGDITFEPLDSDEGQLLASKFAFSTSHPRN